MIQWFGIIFGVVLSALTITTTGAIAHDNARNVEQVEAEAAK